MKRLPSTLLVWLVCVLLSACSSQTKNNSVDNGMDSGNSAIIKGNDTTAHTPELTKRFIQAITEYIHAIYKNDQTVFDTLYFGKHVYGQPDDFPDIELPKTIEHTEIRLVSPEVGEELQKQRPYLVYINMMGWVEEKKAEFILVTFSNGAQHQFDCYIDYNFSVASKEFELDKMRLEYFSKGGKVDHITDYKDGKFVKRISNDRNK